MNIKIPNNAVKYILFQRTAYLMYQNNRFLNSLVIRVPFLSYNRMVSLEAFLFKGRIKKLFNADMKSEYESIKEYLPKNVFSVLDIGCGVAGIDVLLNKHYKELGRDIEIFLLDKTETASRVYYGLEKRAAYYNSLFVAREILERNGVKGPSIHTQEAAGGPIFPGKQFDLVVSLISWGFHYPVETYLDEVYGLLKLGGKLIIDIRKGSGGEKLIEKKFGNIELIFNAPQKHIRIVSRKTLQN
mgnify:CR=1 FL=1